MSLFIVPKEIAIVIGKSLKTAQKHYNIILSAYNKEKKAGLTIKEFASYHGITEEEVRNYLGKKR